MSFGFGFGLAPTVVAPWDVAETPLTLLLHDQFTGAAGLLSDHDPDTVWFWDNWQVGGHSGVAWSLSGSGTVSQTDYPTGGEGIRSYVAYIQAASNEALVKTTFTSPTSETQWAGGVIARMSDANNYWVARLNARNDLLELSRVQGGSENVEQSKAFVTAENTEYTVEIECVGDTIVARCGAVVTDPETNTFNNTKTRVGLQERVALNGGHCIYSSITVEHAPGASATASRIFYSPANASVATEWDGTADITGTGSSAHNSTLDIYEAEITADGTGADDGVRFDFHCDDTGVTPTKKAASALKNLPDFAMHSWYVWIPLTQRLGSFWLLWQQKQRQTDSSTFPLLSWNLGWNGAAMITEINCNIVQATGAFDNDAPDLSTTHYVFPDSDWVRVDIYYKWHETDGRFAMWLDGRLIYDFNHVRTMCSIPPEDWVAGHFPRTGGPANYGPNLLNVGASNNTVKTFMDNYSIAVPAYFGERLPDEYPGFSPV